MIQHYVPKVYLRNFGQEKIKGEKTEWFVDVYDKSKGTFFKTNIKNICAERHFYTLDDETKVAKDKMAVERVYSDFIEPMYQRAFDILTNDNVIYISEHQRAEILIGIMQLWSRNPSVLTQIQENARLVVSKMIHDNKIKGFKGITYMSEDYSFRDNTDEMIFKSVEAQATKAFKELHLKGTQEMLEFHSEAILQVEKLDDGSHYFTSDNPLVMTDFITDDRHPFLRSKNFRIALNKQYSLLIQHDNRKELNRLYKCYAGGGNAWSSNKDVMNHCSRFVITNISDMRAYQKMDEFMNDEDRDKMINVIRQVVEKFENDIETAKPRKVMKEFLERYDKGETNEADVQQMFRETLRLGKEIVQARQK